MARFSERDTRITYEAAERFRDQCLRRDGSLLFEGAAIWTAANLDKLHEVFVAAPDDGDRSFIDKFRDQVKPSGQPVTRLAAEVLSVYFLFPSNVGGSRKCELVGDVLSWASDTLATDHLVALAFANGIGSGGQGYNTRRPFELWFLIELARAWKKLPKDQQEMTLADPWKFEAFVDGIDGADARQLRHMLLHLMFPAEFERIASSNHKRRIIDAFKGLVSDSPDGEDRQLLAIRKELERLLPKEELDFYWSPLDAAWYDATEGSGEFAPLEVIKHKKQVVLYGPPGTGKTLSRQEARGSHHPLGRAFEVWPGAVLQGAEGDQRGRANQSASPAASSRLQLRGLRSRSAHHRERGDRVSARLLAPADQGH